VCPQPVLPPQIASQYAASVGTTSAVVEAQINPNFWPDTRYYVQYGTAECPESGWQVGCTEQPAPPGSLLDAGVTNTGVGRGIAIEGLTADTTYHFRFVAQSGGGGPVYGVDPDGEGPKEATQLEGLGSTFRTYRPPGREPCPNDDRRGGAAASLPDCRAYEMVSPVEKNGGDVNAYSYEGFDADLVFKGLDQSAPEGTKLTYTASTAFADPEGAPIVSQYIASRGEGGWASESIDPPMQGGIANHSSNIDSQFKAFSEDLAFGWLMSESGLPLTPGPTEGFQNLYRRENATSTYSWLESSAPEPEPCVGACPLPYLFPELEGFTADNDCAVFRVNDALTPEARRGVAGAGGLAALQLYLWCEGEGLRLVSVPPDGTPFAGESSAGTEYVSIFGATFAKGRTSTVENALSEDGTRVYWTASSEEFPRLFLRVNADQPMEFAEGSGDLSLLATGNGTLSAGSVTVTNLTTSEGAFAVGESISGPGIAVGTTIAALEGTTLTLSAPAIASGAKALRSGSKQVTNLTTSAGAFAVGQRILGSGIPAGTTITAVGPDSLTVSTGVTLAKVGAALSATKDCIGPEGPCTLPVSPLFGRAQFWTASPDGSRAIFSITGGAVELIGGLYEYTYDASEGKGELTKITDRTLGVAGASEDLSHLYFVSREAIPAEPAKGGETPEGGKPNLYLRREGAIHFIATLAEGDISAGALLGFPSPVASVPRDHVARVTPDGSHLAFVSAAPLIDYDNNDAVSGKADREVYLYEAGGELRCASCNPSGARPRGADLGEDKNTVLWTAAWIPGYQHQLYGRRLLSEDGSRLYFNSVDALALRDVNGAQDVYQWEEPGTGSCTTTSPTYSAQNGGCVDLISSGESPRDSEFVEASATGGDVFIRTESSLVPQDPGSVDIYDARVGGGFAAPIAPVPCEGDACQAPAPAPGFQTPAGAVFQGPGDARAGKRRCGKGKVRRKGRCVAKKKRQRKQRAAHNRRAR
jgi:hypothetical protein